MAENLTKEEAKEFFAEFFYGENHIPTEIKPWGSNGWSVEVHGELSTYDFNHLLRLVVMAHDKCIRACIRGSNKFGHMIIFLHKRTREKDISVGHPVLEDAIADYRQYVSKNPELCKR